MKTKLGGAGELGEGVLAHTYDITSVRRRPTLLTLPFTPVAGEARGGGGVVSLGLRKRPFSWPLTPSEVPSLASARFRARSVFHDRDFLYGTGTRNVKQPIRGKLSGVQLSLAAEATWPPGHNFTFWPLAPFSDSDVCLWFNMFLSLWKQGLIF